MDVGIALPQMTRDLDRARVQRWCAAVDDGPFSSVSVGERITFHNLEGMTLASAMAAWTERVRVFFNVVVAPWHPPALLAKQLATIDVLSAGRLDVALGVGGRPDDFVALGVSPERRHDRLDSTVDALRSLWSGAPAADGGIVGPTPIQQRIPTFASAMGPRALARAARWADGVSGFSLAATAEDMNSLAVRARAAWESAGRAERPRLITGGFVALGARARERLVQFGHDYLRVFGDDLARGLAAGLTLHNPEALSDALTTAARCGYDEFIVVPAVVEPQMVDLVAEVVSTQSPGGRQPRAHGEPS
jgi:alkanesulfonate monooxygenase SsuD/methylene tetrahydromethanopterin reductase-like flavin-dependent oxidoreductase (luciferase family)